MPAAGGRQREQSGSSTARTADVPGVASWRTPTCCHACGHAPGSAQRYRPVPAWKHSQYFFRHPLFLQLHPLLCRAPPARRLSACGVRGGKGRRVGGKARRHAPTVARHSPRVADEVATHAAGLELAASRSARHGHGGAAGRRAGRRAPARATHPGRNLGPECVWVALQYRLHRRLPRGLVLAVVVAVQAVAAVAVAARGKALTVAACVGPGWGTGRGGGGRGDKGGRESKGCHSKAPGCSSEPKQCSAGAAVVLARSTRSMREGMREGSYGRAAAGGSQLEAARVLAVAMLLAGGRSRGRAAAGAAAGAAGCCCRRCGCGRRRGRQWRHRLRHGGIEEGLGHAGAGGKSEGACRPCHRKHGEALIALDGCQGWVQRQRGACAARGRRRQHRR